MNPQIRFKERKVRRGPISRILLSTRVNRSSFLWALRCHRALATYPETPPPKRHTGQAARYRFPIWSCSAWGLPCPRRRRQGGALLPHPFTLTSFEAVCSLLHFPSRRRASPLTSMLPVGVRTFLPEGRSPSPLHRSILSESGSENATIRSGSFPIQPADGRRWITRGSPLLASQDAP